MARVHTIGDDKLYNLNPPISSQPVTTYKNMLQSSFKWWLCFCYFVGFPLNRKRTSLCTVYCIFCLVVDSVATLGYALSFYYCIFAGSGTFVSVVGDLLDYTIFFATTCGIHFYVLRNIKKFNSLFRKFDEESIFAGKAKQFTRKASEICLVYMVLTVGSLAVLNALTSRGWYPGCQLEYPPLYRSILSVLINLTCLYPMLVSYTFCFLAVSLGFQLDSISRALQGDIHCVGLETHRNRYLRVIKLFNELQMRFSSLNFLLILASCLTLCMGVFHTLRIASAIDTNSGQAVGVIFIYTTEHLIRMACVCIASDFLSDAAAKIVRTLAEIPSENVLKSPQQMTYVLLQFQTLQPVVSGHGFFTIGKPLLLRVISIVLTYVFVLYQF